MAKNLLEQLRDITVIVAVAGDLGAIAPFKPRAATPNASLTMAAVLMPQS